LAAADSGFDLDAAFFLPAFVFAAPAVSFTPSLEEAFWLSGAGSVDETAEVSTAPSVGGSVGTLAAPLVLTLPALRGGVPERLARFEAAAAIAFSLPLRGGVCDREAFRLPLSVLGPISGSTSDPSVVADFDC
jgi:hypothetical protein